MNILYRPHFWLCVILLSLIHMGIEDALSADDIPKDVDPQQAPMYAPTHTQLFHHITGIRNAWILMMVEKGAALAEERGHEFDTEGYWLRTEACIEAADVGTLTDQLMPESPFSDGWLLLTVINVFLDTCNIYYTNLGEPL